MRNTYVPVLAAKIRSIGFDVFDDWYAAGPEADDYWQQYEIMKGHNYEEALKGHAAEHVFNYDKAHLDNSDMAVLLLPAGRSSHLELGYIIGQGKPGYILFDSAPERYDVMYKFATVFLKEEDLLNRLKDDYIKPVYTSRAKLRQLDIDFDRMIESATSL